MVPAEMSVSAPVVTAKPKAKRSLARRQPQGQSAGTILTNKSNNMTIITPMDQRKSLTAPSLTRGTRWMHRSTLTMERNPLNPDYDTTTKQSYNGSKSLRGAQRPKSFPTLHASHFDIGLNKQQSHDTHYKSQFPHHKVDHPNKLHYQSITNWTRNVVGTEMHDVLSRKGQKPDYWSSYANVHTRLGLQRGDGVTRSRQPPPSYNILTGQESGMSSDRDLHLVSGNRVLHSIRLQPEQSLVLQ